MWDRQTGRSRARGGERPMGTAAWGGKGFKERPGASGKANWRCTLQTAIHTGVMPPPLPPPPPPAPPERCYKTGRLRVAGVLHASYMCTGKQCQQTEGLLPQYWHFASTTWCLQLARSHLLGADRAHILQTVRLTCKPRKYPVFRIPPDTSISPIFPSGYLDTRFFIHGPVGKQVAFRKNGKNGTCPCPIFHPVAPHFYTIFLHFSFLLEHFHTFSMMYL